MSWLQFALLGVGLTTGTGYFLGASIAIQKAEFSVLITFILAAMGTYIVFEALAKMFLEHPDEGSFRTYAKKAFGGWAGFQSGWVYWTSEMLVLGSTLTAIGLFTQYWLPSVPLWILSGAYASLGITIVAFGIGGFERFENALSITKIASIVCCYLCPPLEEKLSRTQGGYFVLYNEVVVSKLCCREC